MELYETWSTYDVYITNGNVYDYIQTIAQTQDWPDKFAEMLPVNNPSQPGYVRLQLYY